MRRSRLLGGWLALTMLARAFSAFAGDGQALGATFEPEPGVEYFALVTPAAPASGDPDGTAPSATPGASGDPGVPIAIGACTLTRAAGGTVQLDVELPLDGTRVIQVEELGDGERSLCLRELRPGGGRTIRFVPSADGLSAVEWSVDGPRRVRSWPGVRALGWLELLELARADRAPARATWIDPLAGAVVAIEIERSARDGLRIVEARSARGLRVARLEFDGDRLVSFAWQAGGLAAERISKEAHGRLLADRRKAAAGVRRSEP